MKQVGPRSKKDRERFPPNNVLLTLAGAGLLWMGWAGFNGGDPYAANTDSSMAVLNTNICAATSLLVWTWLDVIFFKKPSVIGAVQGMITGLVCITPGAGKSLIITNPIKWFLLGYVKLYCLYFFMCFYNFYIIFLINILRIRFILRLCVNGYLPIKITH